MRSRVINQNTNYRGNQAVAGGARIAAKVCEFPGSPVHRLVTTDLYVYWGGNEKLGLQPRCRASSFVIILSPSFACRGYSSSRSSSLACTLTPHSAENLGLLCDTCPICPLCHDSLLLSPSLSSLMMVFNAVLWFRLLLAGLSPWRLGFIPRPVHVGFVVDKVALGQVSLRVCRFFPVSIIPPMLHTLLSITDAR